MEERAGLEHRRTWMQHQDGDNLKPGLQAERETLPMLLQWELLLKSVTEGSSKYPQEKASATNTCQDQHEKLAHKNTARKELTFPISLSLCLLLQPWHGLNYSLMSPSS